MRVNITPNFDHDGVVRALTSELEFFREERKEMRAVIDQLARGYALPGQIVYIHPYDMMELVNAAETFYDIVDLHRDQGLITIKGIHYKQSAFMPIRSKNFK